VSVELLAIGCLIATSSISSLILPFVFRWIHRKESEKLLEQFNVDTIKDEFEVIVRDNLQLALDTIGESFESIMTQPVVKGAMTTLGKMGGDAKAESGLVDQMAIDMLDSDQFATIRMGAEALGLDIEGYIEKNGAIKTLKAAKQLGAIAGIDIMNLDLSNLTGSLALPGGQPGSSHNPYLK